MRRFGLTISGAFLTSVNLIPVLGVLVFDWNVITLIYLYWVENVVVGFFTVARLALVHPDSPKGHLAKLFFIPFFCIHFGLFTVVHGFFPSALFPIPVGFPALDTEAYVMSSIDTFPALPVRALIQATTTTNGWMGLFLAGLLVSHGLSFFQSYVLGQGYRHAALATEMFRPYPRIFVLQFILIAGGFALIRAGSFAGPLVYALIGVKLAVDIFLFFRREGSIQSGRERTPPSRGCSFG